MMEKAREELHRMEVELDRIDAINSNPTIRDRTNSMRVSLNYLFALTEEDEVFEVEDPFDE